MPSSWSWLKSVLVLGLAAVLTASPLSAPPAHAAASSNEGTEFYVTFNYGWFFDYDRTIYLSSRQSGTATIQWPTGAPETVTLTANSITTVVATTKGIVSSGANEATALISARISSTVPISVYGTQIVTAERGAASAEAFTAIPTSSLGTSYRIISSPTNRRESEFSVVATEDGTTVSITPSAALNSRPANATYTVNLQRGQVYTAVADSSRDISGTLITANKKVVVTSANWCANITSPTCDHLAEYMTPIDTWGSSFLLPGSLNSRNPDVYRILAHEDETEVTINGGTPVILNAGQFYAHSGTVVGGVQPVDSVQTSKPVLVAHFLIDGCYEETIAECTRPEDLGTDEFGNPLPFFFTNGDPSFSLVIPTLQFLRQYNVATPASGFEVNSLTLITLTSSVSSVLLNGAPIPAGYGAFAAIGETGYSIARLRVPAGNYSLSSNTGLGVYGSGFDIDISYAYPAGFGLVNLVEFPGGADSVPSDENDGGGNAGENGAGGNAGGEGEEAGVSVTSQPELAATGVSGALFGWLALGLLFFGTALIRIGTRSGRAEAPLARFAVERK